MALTKAHNRMITGSPVNVLDFGAVGDGTTDDTAAIQAAQDYLETIGRGQLVFPQTGNSYRFSALTIESHYIHWLGEGGQVDLECFAATGDALTILKTVVTIENIRITADTGTRVTSGNGITIAHTESYTMNRVDLINVQVDDQPQNGIEAKQAELFYFRDVWCERNGGIGIYFHDDGANIGINCTFINCRVWESVGTGWKIQNQVGFTFIGCESLKSGGAEEVFLQSGTGHQWISGDIERTNFTGLGIRISTNFCRIVGGTIQKVLNGIEVNSTSNTEIINPRFIGDAGTPMVTGVKSISSTNVTVHLQKTPVNVTTPISDSVNARIQLFTQGQIKNLDVRPRRQTIASATPIIPDANEGFIKEIQALSVNTTINAPTNGNIGDTLTFTIIQDATGGRTVTWNSVYKFNVAWSDAGNTASTRSTVQFISDGTNWRQIGQQGVYL
tara:strand:+ start:830 stop:2164 length:1335 start_codon:yes stop_codon:yes gene_type:complete